MSALRATGREPPAAAGGFTLIEIMVVIAILAVAGQIVVSNIGALIPSSILNSDAQKLMSEVEYLRSEAQLQGKTFKLELDLAGNRYRRILPPEMRVTIEQDEQLFGEAALGWTDLDDRCRFTDYEIIGGPSATSGRMPIVIDHNGFTSDQIIGIGMKSDALRDLLWTIQIHGLDRRSRLVRSNDGQLARIEPTTEAAFR